jgi:site-specific recombinase XerD
MIPPRPTPCEKVIEDFDRYLAERALSARTRATYLPLISKFLTMHFRKRPVRLSSLNALDVMKYFQRCVKRLSSTRAQLTRTALRSFFRFAQYRGDLTVDLTLFVPSVAKWSLASLPKSLPPDQVKKVLASCPRASAVGRRAYAVLLLVARLGLRSSEVVNLTLDDIDWEKSRITIRGKMNRLDHLPMPAEVGKAIATYLKCDRPRVSTRRLFLLSKAPWSGFQTSSSINAIVKDAFAWAGIESRRRGAHQFRHSLACEMLRRGRLLAEIGEILRHRRPDTTAIYAKVDFLSLRPLALSWPGGAQ